MEKGTVNQVLADANIMHDYIDGYYDSHEFAKDGSVLDNVNATILLYQLREHINDLLSEGEEEQ